MALENRECKNCGSTYSVFRDDECLECRSIETINLNSSAPTPAVMAQIAEHLERYGKVTIILSAVSERPGVCAFFLGEAYGKAEKQNG